MRLYILAAAAALVAGCVAPAPYVDSTFGQAVNAAKANQVIDPDGPTRARPPVTSDGQAAKSSIDLYQKSFDAPPAPVNVLNIGVGTQGQSQ